jgi:hypothetical protein
MLEPLNVQDASQFKLPATPPATQPSSSSLPPLTANIASKFKLGYSMQTQKPQTLPTIGSNGTVVGGAVGAGLKEVAGQTESHAADIVEDLSQKPNMTGTVDVMGNIAGEVGDFFGDALKAVIPQPVKNSIKAAASAVAGTPEAQAVLDAWNKFSAQHPDAAKDIGNAVNIGALFGGEEVSPTAEEAANAAKTVGEGAAKEAAGLPGDILDSAKSAVKAPINAAQDMATSIEKNVMKVLENPGPTTESTLKDMMSSAKNAVETTGASTPYEIAGKQRLGNALDSLNEKLATSANKMTDALKRVGDRDVDVLNSAMNFHQTLKDDLGTVIDPDGTLSSARGRESLVANSAGDQSIVRQVNDLFSRLTAGGKANAAAGDVVTAPSVSAGTEEEGFSPGGPLSSETQTAVPQRATVRRVADAIDAIQAKLYEAKSPGADPISTKAKALMQQVIGQLNGAVKDATKEAGPDGTVINPYADGNQEYARLVPLRDELNTRLGSKMKNAGAMMKRIFSPQDGGTRDLVKALERETGEPIFHDATLAKFAMEAVGDPRAESLLEQGMKAGSNWLKYVTDYVKGKLGDPEGKALRVIAKAAKKAKP